MWETFWCFLSSFVFLLATAALFFTGYNSVTLGGTIIYFSLGILPMIISFFYFRAVVKSLIKVMRKGD